MLIVCVCDCNQDRSRTKECLSCGGCHYLPVRSKYRVREVDTRVFCGVPVFSRSITEANGSI